MARRPDSGAVVEEKRRHILDAALAVFARKGYGEATVPDIAQEAGVAVGTIYNYFSGKRELLVSLMTERFFTQPFLELLEYAGEPDDTSFLSRFYEDRMNLGIESIDSLVFLLSEVQRDPVVREQYVKEILGPTVKTIEAYLKSRMEAGVFRSRNAAVAARALAGMGIGFVLLYGIERDESPISTVDRSMVGKILADILLNGLREADRGKGEGGETNG